MIGLVTTAVALIAGALVGNYLAKSRVTAANALVGRQLMAYLTLLFAAGVAWSLYRAPQLSWMPTLVVIYGEPLTLHGARALAASALAMLIALEWPGRHDARRLRQLIVGGAVLGLCCAYLAFRALPLNIRDDRSWIENGVVMQTTPYTCAPAAIATLARLFGRDSLATEASVARLAGTTREGTHLPMELRVLRALGLRPRYVRFMTPDSLARAGRPALLHVNEPVTATTIRHAVALLALDPAERTVTIGNPLHGVQVKTFAELAGYWTGEAIIVDARRKLPATWP